MPAEDARPLVCVRGELRLNCSFGGGIWTAARDDYGAASMNLGVTQLSFYLTAGASAVPAAAASFTGTHREFLGHGSSGSIRKGRLASHSRNKPGFSSRQRAKPGDGARDAHRLIEGRASNDRLGPIEQGHGWFVVRGLGFGPQAGSSCADSKIAACLGISPAASPLETPELWLRMRAHVWFAWPMCCGRWTRLIGDGFCAGGNLRMKPSSRLKDSSCRGPSDSGTLKKLAVWQLVTVDSSP
ncbi:hypothetical protein V8C26DRAFT_355314 [Trichoderma gracile]